MADDLRKFDGVFKHDDWPAGPCPTCRQGELHVARGSAGVSMTTVLTADSARAQNHPDWEPEWLFGGFHGVLTCTRPQCGERVIVVGDYRTDVSDDPQQQYTDYFRLRFAWPPIPLMAPPPSTPEAVVERIEEASRIVWADPSSAANALRRAVEAVLDHQRVNKYAKKKSGGRQALSTHDRIVAFKVKDKLAAQSLEAVKWVGNQGSHGGPMTASDVVESAEYLDHALRRIYDKSDEAIARKAAAVNKRKGIKKRA